MSQFCELVMGNVGKGRGKDQGKGCFFVFLERYKIRFI